MKRTLLLVVVLCLTAAPAWSAQPLDVVINEVCWMGNNTTTADEWLELYNNTANPIDLAGWTLVDDGSTNYALSGTIAAHGFFLIEIREEATDVAADLIVGTMNLGNTGDSLALLDDLSATIDQTDTAAGWYAGINGTGGNPDYTMERRDPTAPGNNILNWGDNDGVTINGLDSAGNPINGTPRSQNSIYGQTGIDPEVVNVQVVDTGHLMVWFSTDVDAASAADKSHFLISLLDGTGETNPGTSERDTTDATLVHLTGLGSFNPGEILLLDVHGLASTTGGAADHSTAEFVNGVQTIGWARADSNGDFLPDLAVDHPAAFVTVLGVISTWGRFDNRESFIQDDTAGLSIFDAAVGAADVWVGDEVRISGWIYSYNGKDQIGSFRTVVLSSGHTVPIQVVTLAQYLQRAEALENMLVGVEGVSLDSSNTTPWPAVTINANLLMTDDGGATVATLRIDADTDIDGSVEPTWPLAFLVGIVGQYDDTDPRDGDYQFMPRSLADLQLAEWPDGTIRACYEGPDGTEGVGICTAGTETLTGGTWSTCQGQTLPATSDDTCNEQDDNCDGTPDDGVDFTLVTQCGSCANDCTALAHTANQACDTSGAAPVCTYTCDAGWDDCTAAAGCETALGTNANCAACGDDCTALPNASGSICDTSGMTAACDVTCDGGFGDCTADPGCETTLGTDANCSACGDDCNAAFPNASGACQTGACALTACDANFGDCDSDGLSCETALTSTGHCGSCTTVCNAGESCILTGTVYECSSTCADADGDTFADAACGGTDCDDTDELVYPGATEICDDVDNNCDSAVDETFPDKGNACDGDDLDLCANGSQVCNGAGDGLVCQETISHIEACNNLDDDCDGLVDEDWPTLGEACDGPDSDECVNGQLACNSAGNGVVCSEPATSNQEELCNNQDDDCDGDIDEDFGTYTCGMGVCQVTVEVCIEGEYQQCQQLDKPEEIEISCDDSLDNDCDGQTDGADLDCKTDDGGGCGCATQNSASGAGLGLLALGLLALRRRRS